MTDLDDIKIPIRKEKVYAGLREANVSALDIPH